MIVVHASFPIDPDSRTEALDLAAELVEKSNAEEGMIEYRATVDVVDENTVRFFEQYEDEAALGAHTQTDHFNEFAERLPDLLAGEPTIHQFEVSDVSELEL